MKANYKNCTFVKSAAALTDCPTSKSEIAFAGRSNAGKSSALNYLTNHNVARTSKTPGRTQLINFFSVGDDIHLVDLPGYGYAKVSRDTREKWQKFISDYLMQRDELIGLVIVMDSRHPLQKIDVQMLDFCADTNLEAHIILTKADKLSKNIQRKTYFSVEKELEEKWNFATVQLLSSTKKSGAEELTATLNHWFEIYNDDEGSVDSIDDYDEEIKNN